MTPEQRARERMQITGQARDASGRQVLLVRADGTVAYVDGPATLAHIDALAAEVERLQRLLRECRDYVEEVRGEADHAAMVTYRGYPRAQRYERAVAERCEGLMARIDAAAPPVQEANHG